MAGRVVGGRPLLALRRVALASLLFVNGACGSFDPVERTHYVLLSEENFASLGIPMAHWVAYDDQHSLTASCTNGAAGNHLPRECSRMDRPYFNWDGGKCPPSAEQLQRVNDTLVPGANGICIQGELSAFLPCNTSALQCRDVQQNGEDHDVSNMWGAGVGLSFSKSGKDAWDPDEHGVKGVAFDLLVFPEDTRLGGSDLNLRVQIPSILKEKDTQASYGQPLMREDGSVVDVEGNVYPCDAERPASTVQPPVTLERMKLSSSVLTSEQHPFGSSFWQLATDEDARDWGPSPVVVGHNEFAFSEVAHPPGNENETYYFDSTQILGVHFQVTHPKVPLKNVPFPFAFCINHLAFLTE